MRSQHRYGLLSASLYDKLVRIAPAETQVELRPCLVVLSDGTSVDQVYIVAEHKYFPYWGIAPEEDSGKQSIPIETIRDIAESPSRLPLHVARKLYQEGESGMGYHVFTLIFKDGTRQAYLTGNAVDFVPFPDGKGPRDVSEVLPHEGRSAKMLGGNDYYWSIFSEVDRT